MPWQKSIGAKDVACNASLPSVSNAGGRKRSTLGLYHQLFQCLDIASIVTRFVNWRFGDESGVRQSQVVQQNSKRLFADGSLPHMLMPVKLGAARGFGIVAVPDFHLIEPNGRIEMP